MQQFQDGMTQIGPGGVRYTRQGGQWVASTPGFASHPPGPTAAEATARNAAETRASVANAEAAELRLAHERQVHADEVAARAPPPGNLTLHGPEYMAQARQSNPQAANMAQALLEGRVPYPTGSGLRTPLMTQAIAMAQQADPSYDANVSAMRHQALLNFTGNNSHGSAMFRSGETLAGHVQQLSDVSERLSGPNMLFAPLSRMAAGALQSTGSEQADLARYNTLLQLVANEGIKFTTQAHGGEGDRNQLMQSLRPDQSIEARRAAIQSLVGAVHSALDAYRTEYQRAFPDPLTRPRIDWLNPDAVAAFRNLDPNGDWGDPNPPDPSAPTASARPGPPPPPGPPPSTAREYADQTARQVMAQGGAVPVPSHGDTAVDPNRALVNQQIQQHYSAMYHGGASDDDLRRYGASVGLSPSSVEAQIAFRRTPDFRRWNATRPNEALAIDDPALNRPMNGLIPRMATAVASSGPGTAFTHMGDAMVPLPLIANLTGGSADQTRAALDATADEHPLWATGGSIAGQAAAYNVGGRAASRVASALDTALPRVASFLRAPAAGTEISALTPRALAADATYGAYYGGGENDGSPLAMAEGAGANTLGGMFGRSAGRFIGRTITGSRDPATQYLTAQGVPLTLGDIAGQGGIPGRMIRSVEQGASSVPFLGDSIKGQYRNGFEGFNRAAFNQSVDPIGNSVARITPANTPIGEAGLAQARGLRSNAYDRALAPLNANPLQIDPQFTADMGGVRTAGASLPPDLSNAADYVINNRINPAFNAQSQLSGDSFQQAIRGIRSARSQHADMPFGEDFGNVMTSADSALTDMASRQAPQVMPELNAANLANRRVSTLGAAVKTAVNQVDGGSGEPTFTPAQLNRASVANTVKYGGTDAATSSARPFYDLGRYGQQVLGNRLPNSGTASRLLPMIVLGGAGYGSDEMGYTDHAAALGAGVGALSLPYSNAGRWTLQTLLARRPQAVRDFGETLLTGRAPDILPGWVPYSTQDVTFPGAVGMFAANRATQKLQGR